MKSVRPWQYWTIGIAILLMASFILYRQTSPDSLLKLVDQVPATFRVGLGDHIRCAVLRKPRTGAADAANLIEPLGAETRQLAESIQSALPAGYRVAAAHHCRFEGRRVIHVAIRASSGPVSLVIVQSGPGESLQSAPDQPLLRASVETYEMAAFSSRSHLVFLVSQEGRGRNDALLLTLAPALRGILEQIESKAD